MRMRGDWDRGWLRYGFVAPALVLLIAVNIFPLLYSIVLSFTNADLVGSDAAWVGVLNYKIVFKFAKYGQALRTTALFVFLAVTCELLLGFGLAYALRDRFALKPPRLNDAPRSYDAAPSGYGPFLEAHSQWQLRCVESGAELYGILTAAVDNGSRPKIYFRADGGCVDVDALYDAHIPCGFAVHSPLYIRSSGD